MFLLQIYEAHKVTHQSLRFINYYQIRTNCDRFWSIMFLIVNQF